MKPNVWKYLRFSHFFLFHVISKQLLCHLCQPFCVCESLSSTISSMSCSVTKQTWKSCFASSLTASNTKCSNLTWLPLEIMHLGHTWHDYLWPWVSLTKKFAVRFWPIRKEIVSWMYKITVIKHCSLVHDCPIQVTKLATFSVLSLNFFLLEFMECSVSCFFFFQN